MNSAQLLSYSIIPNNFDLQVPLKLLAPIETLLVQVDTLTATEGQIDRE